MTAVAEDTKVCPFCAETIKAAAIVCKHCGRDQPSAVEVLREPNPQTIGVWTDSPGGESPPPAAYVHSGGDTLMRVLMLCVGAPIAAGILMLMFAATGAEKAGGVLFVLAAIPWAVAVYFLPTYEAKIRKHRNLAGVFILNFFLGWTLLGWVGALVWAVSKDD